MAGMAHHFMKFSYPLLPIARVLKLWQLEGVCRCSLGNSACIWRGRGEVSSRRRGVPSRRGAAPPTPPWLQPWTVCGLVRWHKFPRLGLSSIVSLSGCTSFKNVRESVQIEFSHTCLWYLDCFLQASLAFL